MRCTVYKCDECRKEIGDVPHFSFSVNHQTGVAIPPTDEGVGEGEFRGNWTLVTLIPKATIVQFCSLTCLFNWAKKAMEQSCAKFKMTAPNPPKPKSVCRKKK